MKSISGRIPSTRGPRMVLLVFCMSVILARPGQAQEVANSLEQAYEKIEIYVARIMERNGTPGLSLAITTKDSLLYSGAFGYADIKLKTPVTEKTLFQIGSITKSFTALSLMRLYDKGVFDPQRGVHTYLPWFEVQSEYEPLTAHDLLTHSAGIPGNRDDMTGSPYQAYALRQQMTGWAPGGRFHYSNVGYQTLHVLLEKLSNRSYADIIAEDFFAPLGMPDSQPVIALKSRSLQAVGYIPPYNDRPHHRSRSLIEAPYFNYGIGDGSIQSTATDMTAYVRMLLNEGRGPQSRLVSEEAFDIFSTPHIARSRNRPGNGYGYGIGVRERDGHQYLDHSGGMVGFGALIQADLTDGLGVAVMANGPAYLRSVAEYSLSVVRAALNGETLAPVPEVAGDSVSESPGDYAGSFQSAAGESLVFASPGNSTLTLVVGSQSIPLEHVRGDMFYTTHPDFDRYRFVFVRDESDAVVEVIHGPEWYRNDQYQGATTFDAQERWETYAGRYRSYSPWLPYVEVFVRKGRIILVTGEGGESSSGETELYEMSPGVFRMDEDPTPEIIRFEDIVDGHALRLLWTGHPLFRASY